MKARVSPVQWSKPHSILASTQDSNLGGRIQNHMRWPLHYHCAPLVWTFKEYWFIYHNKNFVHVIISLIYQTHLRSLKLVPALITRQHCDQVGDLGSREEESATILIIYYATWTRQSMPAYPHHPPSTSARCRAITQSQGPEWLHLLLHGSRPRNPMPAKTARRLIDLQTPIIVSREENSGPSPSVIDHSDSTSWPSIRQTSRPVGACHR